MFRFPTVIIVSTTLVLEHLSHLVGISTSTKIYYPFNQKREKYYPISIDLAPKESEKSQGFHTDRYSTTMWSGGRRQGKNGPAGTRKCSPDDSDRTVQAARGRRQSLAPHIWNTCARLRAATDTSPGQGHEAGGYHLFQGYGGGSRVKSRPHTARPTCARTSTASSTAITGGAGVGQI
jgi:hypothetical protein